jgi:hypothetical protein
MTISLAPLLSLKLLLRTSLFGSLVAACAIGCGGSSSSPFGDGSNASHQGGDDDSEAGPSFNQTGDDDASLPTTNTLADAGCATAQAQAKRQPVYLLFVLDGSGSMSQDNKWAAAVPALDDIFSKMQMAADPGVGAGLIVFSDEKDPTVGAGPYPSSADVPIAYVNSTQSTALSARTSGQPAGGTPTHAALTGGYGELESFTAKSPLLANGKKVLVLITDGAPSDDCGAFSNLGGSSNPCITLAGQELKQASPKGPIETFVIGVGSLGILNLSINPPFLGALASAGGTAPMGCDPNDSMDASKLCFFLIDPTASTTASALQAKFETALETIRGQVVSCTFPLQSTNLTLADTGKVNVVVNGTTILQDPKDGWTYDDPNHPTSLILHGAACTKAETVTAKVSVVLGCKTEMPK